MTAAPLSASTLAGEARALAKIFLFALFCVFKRIQYYFDPEAVLKDSDNQWGKVINLFSKFLHVKLSQVEGQVFRRGQGQVL